MNSPSSSSSYSSDELPSSVLKLTNPNKKYWTICPSKKATTKTTTSSSSSESSSVPKREKEAEGSVKIYDSLPNEDRSYEVVDGQHSLSWDHLTPDPSPLQQDDIKGILSQKGHVHVPEIHVQPSSSVEELASKNPLPKLLVTDYHPLA